MSISLVSTPKAQAQGVVVIWVTSFKEAVLLTPGDVLPSRRTRWLLIGDEI